MHRGVLIYHLHMKLRLAGSRKDSQRNRVLIFSNDGRSTITSLIIILVLAEASTDTIKDVLFGRKTTLSDLVFSNILKLMLISRYHFYIQVHRV